MPATLFGERFISRREPAWHGLGEVFNKDRAASVHEKSINESNIASIYADNVLNTDQPLKEHLKTHPVLTGMKYSDLGIDPATMIAVEGEEGDGILDQDERDSLSDEHIDLITTSLSFFIS